MNNYFYLYRIDGNGDASIYGRFPSLSMAKLSAKMSMIQDVCFILSGDMTKIYFYEKEKWSYDMLTPRGKLDFLECFPDPQKYKAV